MPGRPRVGELLLIDGRASVQFAGDRRLRFRVLSVDPKPTYYGWVWLTGYVLDERGEAVERREVYVQLAGLIPLREAAAARPSQPQPAPRPAGRTVRRPPITSARDQASVHRAMTYPQRGSLV